MCDYNVVPDEGSVFFLLLGVENPGVEDNVLGAWLLIRTRSSET